MAQSSTNRSPSTRQPVDGIGAHGQIQFLPPAVTSQPVDGLGDRGQFQVTPAHFPRGRRLVLIKKNPGKKLRGGSRPARTLVPLDLSDSYSQVNWMFDFLAFEHAD
jgi:hypothetical protein